MVAVSYHEVRLNTSGLRVKDAGFFTGIADIEMDAGNYAMPTGPLPHLLGPRLSGSQDEVTGNWKLLCNKA